MLAAIIYESGFPIDDFMAEVASALDAGGVRICGVVQRNSGDETCSAMTAIDLASHAKYGISQNLGPQSQGCRLDTHGLASVAAALEETIDINYELLIINKFGKAEAEGHGLRAAVPAALEMGIPLLTAVRPPHTAAWSAFHGGIAIDLPPRMDAVLDWCRSAVDKSAVRQQAPVASKL
jgi:hypothetical protein